MESVPNHGDTESGAVYSASRRWKSCVGVGTQRRSQPCANDGMAGLACVLRSARRAMPVAEADRVRGALVGTGTRRDLSAAPGAGGRETVAMRTKRLEEEARIDVTRTGRGADAASLPSTSSGRSGGGDGVGGGGGSGEVGGGGGGGVGWASSFMRVVDGLGRMGRRGWDGWVRDGLGAPLRTGGPVVPAFPIGVMAGGLGSVVGIGRACHAVPPCFLEAVKAGCRCCVRCLVP